MPMRGKPSDALRLLPTVLAQIISLAGMGTGRVKSTASRLLSQLAAASV